MLGANDIPVTHQAGALQQVAEFANIPREGIEPQLTQGRRGETQGAVRGDAAEEGLGQPRQILATFPQGRHGDGEGVDTVIEVLTKLALPHHDRQGPVGGGDQADIGPQGFAGAHPPVGTGLQQAQQLDLDAQRDVTDLIEEEGATGCRLHQARFTGDGTGKGPALVPEEFALEEGLGEPGTVDGNEGAIRPPAGLVHGIGHQFLASAGFPQQQHAGPGRGHPGHQFQHAPEGRGTADEGVAPGLVPGHPQALHLFHEAENLPPGIEDRGELDIDVLLAMGRVVEMQHPFPLAGRKAGCQGARLPGLIAGDLVAVGHGVAGLADHLAPPATLAIARIGGQDAIVAATEDMGFGEILQVGDELGQGAVLDGHGCLIRKAGGGAALAGSGGWARQGGKGGIGADASQALPAVSNSLPGLSIHCHEWQ